MTPCLVPTTFVHTQHNGLWVIGRDTSSQRRGGASLAACQLERMHACGHCVPLRPLTSAADAAEDITYLIFFIGYQYYFAVLKLYALFTLHVTSWGTREGVAAAGAGGKDKEEVDPEAAHEQRVQMAKKGRTANKTYQKGNIALMRRIHMHNLDDDGVRAPLHPPNCALSRPRCRAVHFFSIISMRWCCVTYCSVLWLFVGIQRDGVQDAALSMRRVRVRALAVKCRGCTVRFSAGGDSARMSTSLAQGRSGAV